MAGAGEIPPIPPTDLTTAVIDAVDIILTELHISPLQLLLGLFSGTPKDQDTNNVIWAYHMSAYWPLQALGNNLAMALKNGAPISDSRPAIQAEFSGWKLGTIESIQAFAMGRSGSTQPGYWTLLSLIDRSWGASGSGQQAVLQYVKAIDALTQVLAQTKTQPTTPPATPPPVTPVTPPSIVPPPGTPPPTIPVTPTPPPFVPAPPVLEIGPCESGNPSTDEVLDLCMSINAALAAILAALQKPEPGSDDQTCCNNIVTAIASVVNQLTVIAVALVHPPGNKVEIDFTAIVAPLIQLAESIALYPPAFKACCQAILEKLQAIADALGPKLNANLKPIIDALNEANALQDVPQSIIDVAARTGALTPELAQLISGAATVKFHAGTTITWWEWITGPTTPGIAQVIARNVKHLSDHEPLEKLPINSASDILVAVLGFIGIWLGEAVMLFVEAASEIGKSVATEITKVAQSADPTFSTDLPLGIGAPAVWALKYVQSAPAPGEKITTANYKTVVQDAMGRAGSVGMAAYAAAMTGGLLLGPWEKSWGEVAAMLATAAGFEEISHRWMDPFLDSVIGNRARQDANSNWPTRVPPGPQGLALFARRKITQAAADQLQGFAGLDPDWRPAMYAGAYRPVTPFVLASAFVDQPIERSTLLDILQDNAYSDSHANTMADAILYKSIANVRNSYLSALVSGYGKGVISDDELDAALTDFNFSDQAKLYVKQHVLILRREQIAAKAQSEIVPLVVDGVMTPDDALQQLEVAGLQPWMAQLEVTLATTRATAKAALRAAAADRRARIAEERNMTRAAVAEYQRGVLDNLGLSAALTAIGLDPTLVTSIVAVQDATRSGKLRLVYGQLLQPVDAQVLIERVAAIAQQTKDQLITVDQAAAQLKGLNIPDEEVQALISRWAALLKKSAGAAVYVPPQV